MSRRIHLSSRHLVVLTVLTVAATVTAGCAQSDKSANLPSVSATAPVEAAPTSHAASHIVIDASWATYYQNLSDLKNTADVAVVATVVKQYPSMRVVKLGGSVPVETTIPVTSNPMIAVASAPASASNVAPSDDQGGYITTDFDLKVSNSLLEKKGVNTGNVAHVTQTGGVDGSGTVYEVSDDPLFKVGEQVIVFLVQYGNGKFRVSGGPSGRFAVNDGKVSAIVADGVPIDKLALSSFAAKVS